MPFFEQKTKQHLVDRSLFGGGYFTAVQSEVYAQLSTLPLPDTLRFIPKELQPCIDLVYKGANQLRPKYEDTFVTPVSGNVRDEKKVIVAFSGGNDSTATVLKLKAQGYDPILFFVQRINNSYPNEFSIVTKAAEKFGLPLVVAKAFLKTKSGFKEQPTKDQLIMALMVDYGITIGVNQYATGNEKLNFAKDSNVLYNWSDCVEMHEAAAIWFRAGLPTYELLYGIESRGDSIKTLVDAGDKWLDSTMCCMLPYRYQASRKEANEKKFGIKLGKNRCGSCYKCCAEYLCLVGLRAVEKPSADFARHCWKFFKERLDIIYTPGYGSDLTEEQLLNSALDGKYIHLEYVKELLGVK